MPGRRRAPAKRTRRRWPARGAADPLPPILQIEEPLLDAIYYVQALHFVGRGLLAEQDNGGEAIMAVARMASERLEAVKEMWNRMLKERRGQKS